MKRLSILVLMLMTYAMLGGWGHVMALQVATKPADIKAEAAPAAPETVAIKSEADRYHHQLLANKYALDEQKINNLIMQFLNSNDEAKRLQADMRDLNDQMNALVDKLYKDQDLKPDDYDIKGDPPQFVRRTKK